MNDKKIEEVVLFQIEKTNKTAKQFTQKEFDRLNLGITVDQWVLLKIIHEHTPLSQRDLAEKSQRDPASITRTLDILEKKSFIYREAIPTNRRQYNIVLSEKGMAFVLKHIDLILEQRKRSVQGISSNELKQFSSILKKIQQNMS